MFVSSKVRSIIAVGAASLTIVAASVEAASAQDLLSGVTSCAAPGGQQTTGALLGTVLGAVAGNGLSKGDRTAGTALGALVGGAAGSWMGCKVQRDREDARYDGYVAARDDLARDPGAYRRAVIAQRREAREEADRRYWDSRYQEVRDTRSYGYDRSGRYDQSDRFDRYNGGYGY